jgi:hypothetical protein
MLQAKAAPEAPAPITSTPTGSFSMATSYKETPRRAMPGPMLRQALG